MRISTITTEFDENEDRVRLAVADDKGAARVLWLTRRLGERLAPALIKGLNVQQTEEAIPPDQMQAAQVYAQLEARISKKPGKPVVVAAQAEQGLVHEMTVKTASNGVRVIVFQCKGHEPAELVLRPADMRLWLEALHRAFAKGQWRQDIWPQWLQHQANGASRRKP